MFHRPWQFLENHHNGRFVSPQPFVLAFVLVVGCWLGGCQTLSASEPTALVTPAETIAVGNLKEVAPPRLIQALTSHFNQYQPQVDILSPAPDAVLKKTTVAVKLNLKDLPISDDADIPLRPHLHLILDNEPYRAIYDPNEAIALEDLEPGTHTLRVFPVRPWHESYKNDGAYAQTTFHVLTKTDSNNPNPDLPLLTYSRPKGDYGAEPILLDYYLTNAPLHIAAATDETLEDWRIRVTINDQSFLLDQWQPIYLEGFQTGENWVKLEFIDDQGNLVANRFNNTVRVINYQPGGEDALSRLMRSEVTLGEAYGLTGVTLPEFLPDEEEIVETVEDTKDTDLPAAITPSETLEESTESETDLEIEIDTTPEAVTPELDDTLANPVLPPNPVESPAPTAPTEDSAEAAIAPGEVVAPEDAGDTVEAAIPPAPPTEQPGESGQSLTDAG